MDPADSLLIFSASRIGVPFGLAVCFGLVAACGAYLLRPWPPTPKRRLIFLGVLLLSAVIAYGLARKREVRIDFARQEVEESVQAVGLGWSRAWPFREIRAVVVERVQETVERGAAGSDPAEATQVRFILWLRAANGAVELQRYDDVIKAEAEAFRVGVLGNWTAVRRGYRISASIAGGDSQPLQTAGGRRGIAVTLDSVTRVSDAPGEESAILP